MANCVKTPGPMDPKNVDFLACKLHKYLKKDQLQRAKDALHGWRIEDKKRIVSKTFKGNAPLLIAAQNGMSHFVEYLLKDCQADIEQRGVYVTEDELQLHVTPLWCAARANELEVVKILIRHCAEVNATSATESTALLAACYTTTYKDNMEVVKYLVQNGAAINLPNKNGMTCLMASVNHLDLCEYLLEMKANVNDQDKFGRCAIHFAINSDKIGSAMVLLHHGADPCIRDRDGDDAVRMAALHDDEEFIEYLFHLVKLPIERSIEAYELMATRCVFERKVPQAISHWRKAMEMRDKDKVYMLEQTKPNPVYQNHKEAATMAELEVMATDLDAVFMQALTTCERILGPKHFHTLNVLKHIGNDYHEHLMQSQRCIDLWKYGLKLLHHNPFMGKSTPGESMNKIVASQPECVFFLQQLCYQFWTMYESYTFGDSREAVQFDDILEVLEVAVSELKRAQEQLPKQASQLITSTAQQEQQEQQERFHNVVLLVLHLINLLCEIPKPDDERVFRFKQTVYKLTKLNIRSLRGKCLLHLAVDEETSYVMEQGLINFYSPFPSENVVKVLLECGDDPTVKDNDGNTPLHKLCTAACNISNMTDDVRTPMEGMVNALLKAGAHANCGNNNGVIATHRINSWYPQYRVMDHITLQCLAARAIKKFNIPYRDVDGKSEVPDNLLSFLDEH